MRDDGLIVVVVEEAGVAAHLLTDRGFLLHDMIMVYALGS